MPYGLAVAGRQLVVADTANSRLLRFDLDALATGMAADALAGQKSFAGQGENRWQAIGRILVLAVQDRGEQRPGRSGG